MAKNSPHQKYYLKDGTLVPGTTRVISVLAKPALVGWANRLGLEGIEVGKYVDNLADIGTMAHGMIEAHLSGKIFDTSDYSKNQIDKAENCFLKFLSWRKANKLKVIGTEMQLVSEIHKFGGTCDLYCELNGVKTLMDIKTAKAVYDEHFTQVSAYTILLEENGHKVEDIRILRVGRDDQEGFADVQIKKFDLHVRRFLAALEIYNINRQLKKKEA